MQYVLQTCAAAALYNYMSGGTSAENLAAAAVQRGMIPATTLLHNRNVSTQFVNEQTIRFTMSAMNKNCGIIEAQDSVCVDPSNVSKTMIQGDLNGVVFPFKATMKKASVLCQENGDMTPLAEFVATVEQEFERAYQGIEKWVTKKISENSSVELPDGRTTEQPVFFRNSLTGKIEYNSELAMWLAQGTAGTALATRNSVMIATNKAAMARAYENGQYYATAPTVATPNRFVLNENMFADSVKGDSKTHIYQVYEGELVLVSYSHETPQATFVSSISQLDSLVRDIANNGNISGVRKFMFRDNIGLLWIMEVSSNFVDCDPKLGKQEFFNFRFSCTIDAIIPALALPTECGLNGRPAIYDYFDGYTDGVPANTEPAPTPTLPMCVNIISSTSCASFDSFELSDATPTVLGSGSISPTANPSTSLGLANCLNVICAQVPAVGNATSPRFTVQGGVMKYYDNGSGFLVSGIEYTLASTGSCDGEVVFEILKCEG